MSDVTVIKTEPITDSTIEREMEMGVTEIIEVGSIAKSISVPRSSVRVASPKTIRSTGCIVPPYNPSVILQYKGLDSTFQTCIEIKRDTIVGRGYSFGLKDIDERDDIRGFFRAPNGNFSNTFTAILKNMYDDLELFHNGFLEFVKSGDRRSIYYLPTCYMYIKPKGNTREVDGYYFIADDNSKPIRYEPYPIDGDTRDGVHYCLHFKFPSQEDIFYGKPDTAHLFDLIKQSYLSDQYNINFFSNGGQPAWAVLITGGKLSKKSYEKIREFIDKNLKGVSNAHKMLFLSVPNEKATIKLVPLSKAIDEQFLSLSTKLQFRIALKCRVLPKLLGLSTGGNFGGGSAGVTDLKLFLETVVKPTQAYVSEFINRFLEKEFGVNCLFTLNIMSISNEKDDAVIANIYWNMVDGAGNRVLGINEIRQMFLQLKPIDLKDTNQDERQTEDMGNLEITPTVEGETRTNTNQNLNIGDGQAAENLDPNKNNDEKI